MTSKRELRTQLAMSEKKAELALGDLRRITEDQPSTPRIIHVPQSELGKIQDAYYPAGPAAVAILAVALMLENKAETAAVSVGADIADYQATMQRAGELRRTIAAELVEDEARKLYEELTQ